MKEASLWSMADWPNDQAQLAISMISLTVCLVLHVQNAVFTVFT